MSIISPELLERLDQKAREHVIPKNSWEGCAILLKYLNNALQRIPTLAELEATDNAGIECIFVREVTYLAAMVDEIFDGEGMEELATYLYEPLQLP